MQPFWYELEPEVPGQWGDETVVDTLSHPPVVSRLHFVFDGWLGDDLVESFPCYLVTDRLAQALNRAALTGVEVRDVLIGRSDTFLEMYPDRKLPEFRWLHVNGSENCNGFWMSPRKKLGVSAAAFAVLQRFQLDNCDVAKIDRTNR